MKENLHHLRYIKIVSLHNYAFNSDESTFQKCGKESTLSHITYINPDHHTHLTHIKHNHDTHIHQT